MSFIALVRHAEATKNVEARHGGPGTPLTSTGSAQCSAIAAQLYRAGVPPTVVLTHSAVAHVAETASLVGKSGGWRVCPDTRLDGVQLGVLAGLSHAEAMRHHPAAAARLDAWRRGQASVMDLEIPDAEPIDRFERRVRAALVDLLVTDHAVVVATRSVLTMMTHLLRLGDGFSYADYLPIEFPNASVSLWNGPSCGGVFARVESCDRVGLS